MTDQDSTLMNAKPTSASNSTFLQGGHQDFPVSGVLFQIESTYGFTPLAINVGTAYFRRLAASNQAMLRVSSHSIFIDLVRGLTFEEPGKPLVGAIHVQHLSNEVWLTLIHLTCTYIAAKNLAQTPLRCSVRAIMSRIYGVESRAVDPELSLDLEIQCLEALDYKLAPSIVQQEDMSHAADRVARNQEQPDNKETLDPALLSAEIATKSGPSWMADLNKPSAGYLKRDEPVLAEHSHAASRTQASRTSAQPKSAISQFERSMYVQHQHRAVYWVWTLANIFLMFLLIAIRFNTCLMAIAFTASLLGQQTAYWGLTFMGWGLDTQESMAKWFFKVLRAGATISALLSAAVAAAITLDASQDTAAFRLLHIRTSGVSKETFIGVCYALHSILSFMAAKNAHQVQSILDQNHDTMMV